MKERIGETTKNLSICNEIIACRLPGAEFRQVCYQDLPYRIRKEIRGRNDLGIALEINHNDTTKTFVGESNSFEALYFQDRNRRNNYIGEGQVFIENIEDELYIPVVGYTYTSKKFREKGYGTRRLHVMDTISRFIYEEPLYSSCTPRLAQKSIWERLVEREFAEIHEFRGIQRYKFI